MSWTFSTFRHGRKKQDETFQIKVKIRNISKSYQRDFPIEYLFNGRKKKLSLSINEWNSLSKNHKRIISLAEGKYQEIMSFLDKRNIDPTTKIILHLYSQNLFDFTKEIEIQKIKELLAYDLTEAEINEYTDDQILDIAKSVEEIEILNEVDEPFQEDEVGSILLLAENYKLKKEEIDKANKIKDNLLRCDAQYNIHGYPDFSKIIDVFGSYWTFKKINGSRLLNKFDNKIVLRIAQFIFLTDASNRIEDLNFDWLKSYFLHLRDNGFLDTREIRNYTPLELYNFKNLMVQKKNNCKPYSEGSFRDQIKKFKRYFNTVKEETPYLDQIKLNLNNFNFESLKQVDAEYDIYKTQKDHYVNVEELGLLKEYSSTNEDLNLTRDLFFIQTFTSGNRSIDKDIVTIKVIKGIPYLEVSHSKTKSKNITGKFKYLEFVLFRNHGKLPTIKMTSREYNDNLKKIANELNLDRKIEHVINKVNSKNTIYEYVPLFDCISQYFSRHTLVNYLVDAGIIDDDIITLTGHADTKILDHYKKKITVEDKQKIIDLADKNNKVL